jgi:tRNA pseudouridine38-40 synthase
MRFLKLTLAYDGTAYKGWQIQPGQPTVQGTLERAMGRVTGQTIRAVASGRTDSGVHALGQVVSCATDCQLSTDELCRAINANLPRDMRVLQVQEAPWGFHAVRGAIGKCYRYLIQDGPVPDVFARHYSWFVPVRLDERAMHRAAQALVGTHDFSSFEAAGAPRCSTVRTVTELAVRREGGDRTGRVSVQIEANGFLYNMVRNIVGTLVEVGKGKQPESWPAHVLAKKDRRRAGRTAPARGLFLVHVKYDEA